MVLKNKQIQLRHNKDKSKVTGANIGIGVNEYKAFEDMNAFIYTSKEHKEVNATIDALSNEVTTIKQQLADANANKDAIETNKQKAIADAITTIKDECESKLKDKDNTINQQQNIIQQKDETIADLQQQVKEYEDKAIEVAEVVAKYNETNIKKSNEYNEKINNLTAEHNKETNKLTNERNAYKDKYNALLYKVMNTTVWSFLFGGKKDILNQYKEIQPTDADAIPSKVLKGNEEQNSNQQTVQE